MSAASSYQATPLKLWAKNKEFLCEGCFEKKICCIELLCERCYEEKGLRVKPPDVALRRDLGTRRNDVADSSSSDDERPVERLCPTTEDAKVSPPDSVSPSAVPDPGGSPSSVSLSAVPDPPVATMSTPVPDILFLPPFRIEEDVHKWFARVHGEMRTWIGADGPMGTRAIKMVSGVPPYTDDSVDAVPYYMRPHHHTADGRRKLLRKEVLASIVGVLQEVVTRQPRVICAVEQGALIAICLSRPLLVEAACR